MRLPVLVFFSSLHGQTPSELAALVIAAFRARTGVELEPVLVLTHGAHNSLAAGLETGFRSCLGICLLPPRNSARPGPKKRPWSAWRSSSKTNSHPCRRNSEHKLIAPDYLP